MTRPIPMTALMSAGLISLLWGAGCSSCSPDPISGTNNAANNANNTSNNAANNVSPRACVDDAICGAGGRCVNNRCVGGSPVNNTPGNNTPMCANPSPCGDCDPSCTVSGQGPSTGQPFDLNATPSQGVTLTPEGAITLQADTVSAANKVIWIANTGQGTVSKVDTDSYVELARYFTGPNGAGNDPSRTSVNGFGDVYVGNRSAGTISKISGQGDRCADRNSDGQINTSTGAADVLGWGQDECVEWVASLCQGCLIRAVAAQDIAPDGEIRPVVWVGGFNNSTIWKLDGQTGAVLLETTSPVRPYGFALDKKGNLWISGPNWGFGNEQRFFGRIDTKRCVDSASCDVAACDGEGAADACVKQRIPVDYQPYGITVDAKQRVWLGGEQVLRYDPSAPAGSRTIQRSVGVFIHGIAADERGFIYAAGTGGGVIQLNGEDPSQSAVIAGTPGVSNKGLGIDKDGKVWSITQGESVALVVRPGATVNDSSVVATVQGFVSPYTYSDMTGQQLSLATDVVGFYRQTFNECSPRNEFLTTEWKQVRWDIQTTPTSTATIRLRAATSAEELQAAPWDTIAQLPPDGGSPFDLEGYLRDKNLSRARFVEVDVQMTARREVGVPPAPPVLKSLAVTKSCPRIIN